MTKRKPLSTVVAESLAEKIRSGRLQPGAQLPTEAELCAEYDVSRTVVREAVARLRSEGMVVPQQGRGMFVSETPVPRNFSIPDEALRTLPETIALLELRLSVEVESAGLCAERRTDKEARDIRAMMEQVDAQQADPAVVQIHYDYDFHLAIAKAARNEFIHGFLSYLGPMIVPRFQLGYVVEPALKDSYYARIHSEHQAIVDAIERQDGGKARQAMRKHLHNSLGRVRALARASGVEATDVDQKAAAASLFKGMKRPASTGA
ncbi:FadR/GntR family transcriptional regulator [Mesorhizobium sp.]|uniref:FadR/GntR family transcriptional regulator n=1 Tax=Mesorhizobium sp. TaxID=1871066 RepID=UPI000FE8C8BC|nr:FadR/GntR family transcriptional regulator [Mesorhizobium sp.]RWE04081.1 MAG: FadR family transcriptional regulator [Mesorhizobium sp.]